MYFDIFKKGYDMKKEIIRSILKFNYILILPIFIIILYFNFIKEAFGNDMVFIELLESIGNIFLIYMFKFFNFIKFTENIFINSLVDSLCIINILFLPFEVLYILKCIREYKNIIKVDYIEKSIVIKRVLAFFIDILLNTIIIVIIMLVLFILVFIMFKDKLFYLGSIMLLQYKGIFLMRIFGLFLRVLIYFIFYLKLDTSLGGYICAIKLIDKNNQKLTIKQKLLRSIFLIITIDYTLFLPFLFTCIERREPWYDEILDINVVNRNKYEK